MADARQESEWECLAEVGARREWESAWECLEAAGGRQVSGWDGLEGADERRGWA